MNNNCKNRREEIAALVLGELGAEPAKELKEHIDTCEICKSLYNSLTDEEQIIQSAFEAVADKGKNIENKLISQYRNTFGKRSSVQNFKGSSIFIRRSLKIAAAAVIIIAVFIGVNQFGGNIDVAGVAWASLAERVGRIQTCFFNGHSQITGGPLGEKIREQELEIYLSSEYGFRVGTYVDGNETMIQYAIPTEKVIISIMPQQKQYMKMLLTDKMLEKMRLQGNDPREMVRQIMLGEYTHLGESVIDGVKVEGIETNDPRAGGGQFEKYLARCWVNVETQLPIKLEMEIENSAGPNMPQMKMSMVLDNFEWDIDLGPEIFEPTIPPDYKLMAEMQMPGQDEGSAVKGLRIFAQITGGKYPQKLAMMEVTREFVQAAKKPFEDEWQKKKDIDPNFKPTQEEKEEIRSSMMGKMISVQGACMFYAELVKANKDVAYYGDKVTSDDVDTILMRWKISDDEYRVIFGDLTTENISAEELAEFETKLPE